MKIVMHTDEGREIDITEAVQIIYDAMHGGMEFGSGLLDTSEVEALRLMSDAAGWAPVEYELDLCQNCGHIRRDHSRLTRRCFVEGIVIEDHEAEVVVYSPDHSRRWRENRQFVAGQPGRCGCSTFVLRHADDVGEDVG